MCGICGFNWEDKKLLKDMCNSIRHRGPDGKGIYTDNNISLGHRRLSIIDLSARGKQPMSNEDETVWLTYNGEVYNFKDLRVELEKAGHKFKSDTDTEAVVHAYEEWGFKCVEHFEGMFAFAIWDETRKLLFLARDRLGIKPLYYYWDGTKFIFASELKAILKHDFEKQINLRALHQFLSFRCTTSESILKNTFKLAPGRTLVLQNSKLALHSYWEFKVAPTINISLHTAQQKLLSLLEHSVKSHLVSDVPLGAYLSGGVDSGLIVHLMSRISSSPVKTYSVGFGYDDEFDELWRAKQLSEYSGTDHTEIIVEAEASKILPDIIWYNDEPLADPASIPVYLLSKAVKPYATVVLTGDGGDEVFAGYEQVKLMRLHQRIIKPMPGFVRGAISASMKAMPNNLLNHAFRYASELGVEGKRRMSEFISSNSTSEAYAKIVSIFSEEEKRELYLPDVHSKLKGYSIYSCMNKYVSKDTIASTMNMDTNLLLANNMLLKTDRNTMAFSVEARVPYLDHNLVKFVNSLPHEFKLNNYHDKYLLRRCAGQLIPKQIANRKKQRFFVPINKWLDAGLKNTAEDMLLNSDSHLFQKEYLRKIFSNFSHSKLFYSRQIWSLLTFDLWHKMFIAGVSKSRLLKVI